MPLPFKPLKLARKINSSQHVVVSQPRTKRVHQNECMKTQKKDEGNSQKRKETQKVII